jgi:arsenate reductase (glutaredoxin)
MSLKQGGKLATHYLAEVRPVFATLLPLYSASQSYIFTLLLFKICYYCLMKIYGIKNCNTMQKAFKALDDKKTDYTFHDYKKLGIDEATLKKWIAKTGYEKLINKSGLTWKKVDEKTKASVKDEKSAIAIMMQHTSMIKRPVIDTGKKLIVGFDEEAIGKL